MVRGNRGSLLGGGPIGFWTGGLRGGSNDPENNVIISLKPASGGFKASVLVGEATRGRQVDIIHSIFNEKPEPAEPKHRLFAPSLRSQGRA